MFEELINGINKTIEKHPRYTMSDHFYGCVTKYYDSLRHGKGPVVAQKDFYQGFTREDLDGKPVREKLMSKMVNSDKDGALEFFNLVYRISTYLISNINYNNDIINYAHYYIAEYCKINNGKDIEEVRDKIYDNPKIIQGALYTMYSLLEYINIVIKPKESKNREIKSGIVFNTITDTANKRITNVRENRIQDSFGAKLYKGRIQIASFIGNKDRQEDAVLSLRRDNIILNVVADGMGGTNGGHIASMLIVKELANWFSSLDLRTVPKGIDFIEHPEKNPIYNSITRKLQEINDRINAHYKEKNAPGSTVVLSFTTPEYTMIMNVGDSTAYLKTGNRYKQLTYIDAAPEIDRDIVEDYELYRNVSNNNIVSRYIGCGARTVRPHGYVLDHKEDRKILLSSDGVTDLINEENFRKLFLGEGTAIDFVDKALNPDPHVRPAYREYERLSTKKSDNISAIIMDIPKNEGRKM